MPNMRSTPTCECPAPTSTMSFTTGICAACICPRFPSPCRRVGEPRCQRRNTKRASQQTRQSVNHGTESHGCQDQDHGDVETQLGDGCIHVVAESCHAQNAEDRAFTHDDLPAIEAICQKSP